MNSVTLAIGFGLVTACTLALGAVGFTLQFAVADIFNLAFGEIMTIGAFTAYAVWVSGHTSLWAGLLAGAAAGAGASYMLNAAVFAPFRRRRSSRFTMVMVALGVSQILVNLIQIAAGTASYSYPPQSAQSTQVLGMVFTPRQLGLLAVTAVAVLALQFVLHGTRTGKAIRATAGNSDLASICGISTRRVMAVTWLISGAFCGAAGVAFASNSAAFDYSLGSNFLFMVVAAAAFGGVRQPSAAVLGALIIGVASQLAALAAPALQDIVALLALVLVLLLRPAGLLASRKSSLEQSVT